MEKQKLGKSKRVLIPNYCELCGEDYFVSKHRIKMGKDGGTYIPGNVISCCGSCHIKADRGYFPKSFLFAIVQERLRVEMAVRSGRFEGERYESCGICEGPAVPVRQPGRQSKLCPKCKQGLGLFKDDPSLLGAAIEYLLESNG